MDGDLCRVTWPGLKAYYSMAMTLGDGIMPSVCVLTIPPQASDFAAEGTLELQCGTTRLRFPNCIVDSFEPGLSTWRITIFDRRWRWRFGGIWGRYNIRNRDQTIKEGTEKTPRELAKLCLEAMGETKYYVDALPEEVRPEVDWDGDKPAEALQQLCDSLGFRIVPQFASGVFDAVKLCRNGTGEPLAKQRATEFQTGFDPAEAPDEIGVSMGETLVNVHLPLMPVLASDVFGNPEEAEREEQGPPVEDSTGVRPDPATRFTEYSYEFKQRLKSQWPTFDFHAVRDPDAPSEDRWVNYTPQAVKLLRQQALRLYQVRLPFDVPDWGTIESYDQFSLEDAQATTFRDRDGILRRYPAMVYGSYVPADNKGTIKNLAEEVDPRDPKASHYAGAFAIDAESAVVQFSDPVYRNAAEVTESDKAEDNALDATQTASGPLLMDLEPAKLVLVTAIRLFREDRSTERYRKTLSVSRRRTGEKTKLTDWRRHDDTRLLCEVQYRRADNDWGGQYVYPTGIRNNENEVEAAADYYLSAAAEDYQAKAPTTASYPGIVPIQLDGAIRQVTFSASNQASPKTSASRLAEKTGGVLLPYNERRRRVTTDQLEAGQRRWSQLLRQIERQGRAGGR